MGPVYEFASYGDLLRLWVTPDVMQSFALLALLNQQNGKTNNLNAARWLAVDANEGGSAALMTRIKNPWAWSVSDSILYYMLLDPALPAETDPRPAFPTTYYDAPAGRIVAHSDWSSTNTLFDYRASWLSINHQDGDGGQFELYRKGERLTKEMSNYDNNAVGLTTVYHNTLPLQNWCANGIPTNLQWYEDGEWANGSEWMLGLSAGDPSTIMSTGPGYVYAASNLTNLFNLPNFYSPANAATDISQATRMQNTSGTAFDGATFGATAVYFPVSATAAFTGTTLTAPVGAHTMLVTGLAPNTVYGVGVVTNAGGTTVTVTTAGNGGTTDGAGVLRVTF